MKMRTRPFTPLTAASLLAAVLLTGCSAHSTAPDRSSPRTEASPGLHAARPDPLAIALAPQEGNQKTDDEIRRFQNQVRQAKNPNLALEQLGWAFVSKARESFDPGYYKLAEQCALAIEKNDPQSEAAMLLRGHVLDSLHRFREAEDLARQLVARRGRGFDYGLLGDALMEQGRLTDAVAAYQQMMDLHPDIHAYARAAHVRWLKGDLDGAIEAMNLAASAATPHDAESAAWVNTRLANYKFQAGRTEDASVLCDLALSYQSNYPPALLLRGKMLLSAGKPGEGTPWLSLAAQLNPIPEYQWALADALRETGSENDAAAIEAQLRQHGPASDPRTFAVFLATRNQSPDLALRLAREEVGVRGDVFTRDALAWALAANDNLEAAQTQMNLALAEGTQDARLFFHAAIIASRAGHRTDALNWTQKARDLDRLLLPSERKQLQELTTPEASTAARPAQPISAF